VAYLETTTKPKLRFELPASKPSICKRSDKDNIIHSSLFTINDFNRLFKKYNNFTFIEKALLLTFYQFQARPDSTDWGSRTQLHIRSGDKVFNYDFGANYKFPLYRALLKLKEDKLIPKNLSHYIHIANKYLPKKILIQNQLNQYLEEHKQTFLKNQEIVDKFFKLDKPLQKGETYLRSNIRLPRAKVKEDISFQTFTLDKNFTCSFDANLYKKGIFLINNKREYENYFGLFDKDGDYIFIITKKVESVNKLYDTQTFAGMPSPALSPYCVFQDKEKRLSLMALNSRDPGQLLYHLYNYKIQEVNNKTEVLNYFNFPRHQFLTNPSRLLYESNKGSEEQLRYFLSLDFPVYHAEKLGAVFGLWQDSNNRTSFIGDQRVDVFQTCLEK